MDNSLDTVMGAVLCCAAAQVVLPEGVYDVNGQQLDTR